MPQQRNAGKDGRLPGWVQWLAAPRWSVLFFLLTAAAALAVAYQVMAATALIAVPFALLLVNVGAAIFANARFRTDLPLLLFHLALVALVALIAMARLTYMEGTTTLSSGTAFEGLLLSEARGPLHAGRLSEVHFANEGFTENYAARGKVHTTYNRVRWQDDAGQWNPAQIGDDHPLLIKGYKIYASSHRGFSPLFLWQPTSGAEEYGTVQLADQLDGAVAPAMNYKLPDGTAAWLMLDFKAPIEPAGKVRIDMGGKDLPHTLVLRIGEARHVLRPGDKVDLEGGTLTYARLDSWMGYTVSYDPTRPWMVATILIGIGSLVWFYARRLRWGATEENES
jgi:cytochrome c biogenesis protein ResB